MSKHRITEAHLEPSADRTHEHIESVRIGKDGETLSVETVAEELRTKGGDQYLTKVDGVKAKVEVVECPQCALGEYLRTDPDASRKNLLSLPTF